MAPYYRPCLKDVTPTYVVPVEPMYNTSITESESMKKFFNNLSGSTPVLQWKLSWKNLPDYKYWALAKKVHGCSGSYYKIAWKDVPDYIDTDYSGTTDASSVTVFFVQGSWSSSLNARSWDAEVIVEKEIP